MEITTNPRGKFFIQIKYILTFSISNYSARVLSCGTIWDSVINRSDFLYLASGQVPNFRTINNFRLRHLKDLPGLFTQIVFLCNKFDMLDFEQMAIDGQKIQANANYKNLKGIKKEYDKIQKGLEILLKKEVNEYFTADIKEKRVTSLSKKLDKLDSFQKVLEELNDDGKRINMIDPDAPMGKTEYKYRQQNTLS